MQKAFKDRNGGKISYDPPDYLSKQAREIWRKVVPFLEEQASVKRIDSWLVETYCTQYDIYRNSYKHIKEHGEVQEIFKPVQNAAGNIITNAFIGYKRNPMTQIYDSAVKNLAKIGSELGLSPQSRAELMNISEPTDEKSAAEQMKEFFGNDED